MKHVPKLLAACMLSLGLAGCGDSLVTPDRPSFDGGFTIGGGNRLAPAGPRFDGGFTIGGGHRADTTNSTSAITSTTEATAGDSTVTSRGGYTIGGGN